MFTIKLDNLFYSSGAMKVKPLHSCVSIEYECSKYSIQVRCIYNDTLVQQIQYEKWNSTEIICGSQ